MKTDCPLRPLAIDFVNGEIEPSENVVFASHLAQCACCRNEVETTRRLLISLRSLPSPESRDLTGGILAAIHREEIKPVRIHWQRPFAIAAALALLAAIGWELVMQPTHQTMVSSLSPAEGNDASASIQKAGEWLRENQLPDGSWDVKKWGGLPQFQVALTALPTIAILNTGDQTDDSSRRAIAWLLQQQSSDGLFGPQGNGLPFNHCLATFALLQAERIDFRRQG